MKGPPRSSLDVFTIAGRADARELVIDGPATDDIWMTFFAKVRELIAKGVRRVLLDLGGATGADGMAAAVPLAAAHQDLAKAGGRLVVLSTEASLPEALAATSAKNSIPIASSAAEALALLDRPLSAPLVEAPPPPPPVPVARLEEWDRDGVVEGRIAVPTGQLLACDLPEASQDDRPGAPSVCRAIRCAAGEHEVVSLSVDGGGRGRALALVGVRFGAARPARWERLGKFDNSRARFASFADSAHLAALRAEPDFFEGFYFPWIDEMLETYEKKAKVLAWWDLKTLEHAGATSAFVFLASGEGTSLDVYAGYDRGGALAAVVTDVAASDDDSG